jgi:thiamine transport system permease protein
LSTLLSFAIAIVPAYYIYKKKDLLSLLLENAIFIPFFFPPVSMVIAFSILFSTNGFLARMGINIPILYTLPIIILAHAFYNSPIFVKSIGNALRMIPSGLEEIALVEGAGSFKRFFKSEMPLVIPTLLKSIFPVFTYSFMSFAVVMNLGGLRFSTIEVAIANALRGRFDFSSALVYALAQFVILFFINGVLSGLRGEIYEGNPLSLSKVKPSRLTIVTAFAYTLFEYGIVTIGLAGICFDFYTGKFSLNAFFRLFSYEFGKKFPVLLSIRNSCIVAMSAAFVAVFSAYLFVKSKRRISEIVILPTLGISSAFLAMALLYTHILFGIPYPVLITLGYYLSTVAIAYTFLYQSVKGLRSDIIEAAKMDGASGFRIWRSIELPLLLPVMTAVFFQIFAIVFGEFTVSYTMQTRDVFPLASVVNYAMSVQRYYKESAAFAGLNTLIVFGLFILSSIITQKNIKKSD